MLDAKIIFEIKESEKTGEELTREFKELDCAVESGKTAGMDFLRRLGDLNARYDEWRMNHERLIISAYD